MEIDSKILTLITSVESNLKKGSSGGTYYVAYGKINCVPYNKRFVCQQALYSTIAV